MKSFSWKQMCHKFNPPGGSTMFMFKKMIVGGLLVAGLGSFVFGRNAWTYVKTCGNEIRQTVKNQVPIEFEVKHAQQLVEDLVPEIRHAMHIIAEQQVEVETLENAIEHRETGLNSQKQAMLALRAKLDQDDTEYVTAGRSYSEMQIEKDLTTRFRRFKMAEDTLIKEQEILQAREDSLNSNQDHLSTLISTKKDLEAQLAQLDARMRALQAAEDASDVHHLDDSALNRAKTLISELNTQLDIRERLIDADSQTTGLIPVERDLEPVVDVTEEIDSYFKEDLAAKSL